MNLLGRSNKENQKQRWQEIVERYYIEIDESSFLIFLKDKKKDVSWDCDSVIMNAGFALATLGMEEGYDALKSIGITGTLDQIRQKISAKVTNHELKDKKSNEDDGKAADFYVMLSSVRRNGVNIGSDALLVEWIGTLIDLREQNERQNRKE